MEHVLIVGNSDGIGLAVTKKLLELNYKVTGISKRDSTIKHSNYNHIVQDVTGSEYGDLLKKIVATNNDLNLCIYCAGIGDQLQLNQLEFETNVFKVNLMAAAITTEVILGAMIAKDKGHFIGLSSVADALVAPESPSYSASKAGISSYWEGLGLALRGRSVKLTNVRFGFVDTKMAKSSFRPFMMTVDEASRFILEIIKRPRIRASKPYSLLPFVWLASLLTRIKLLFY